MLVQQKIINKLQNYYLNNDDFRILCLSYLEKSIDQNGLFTKLNTLYRDLNFKYCFINGPDINFLSFLRGVENYNFPIPEDYLNNEFYLNGMESEKKRN